MNPTRPTEMTPSGLQEALLRHEPTATKSEMLVALHDAKKNHTLIGIYCKLLADQPCLTAVTDIVRVQDGVLITLIGYDWRGYFYEQNKVMLRDISGVIPFKTKFENPFFKSLVPGSRMLSPFKNVVSSRA